MRLAVWIGFCMAVAAVGQVADLPGACSIRGIVRDAQTGEPLGRVRVQALPSERETVTDSQGRFELAAPPGRYTLQVSTVGYRVAKQEFVAAANQAQEFDVALSPDMFRHADSVEVHADPFEPLRTESPAELTLLGSEVKNLASVLADDPLRAVQALPGVTSNDDFNARFAVRGADYSRVGLFLDGVLLHAPFHSATEQGASGTLTIFNGDFVEALALETGAWGARYGDRTAGVLDVRLREGSRKRTSVRGAASASNAGLLAEGPLDGGRGSWLASIRKSYLQYIVKRVTDDPTMAGGFWDAQGRVSYDLGARQSLSLSAIEGRSGLDRSDAQQRLGLNSIMMSDYHFTLGTLGWRYTPAESLVVSSRAAFLREKYENVNRDRSPLVAGHYGEWVWNSDATWAWRERNALEVGYSMRRLRDDGYWNFYEYLAAATGNVAAVRRLDEFAGTGRIDGAYLEQGWTLAGGRVRLAAGGRWDRQTATGLATWSPHGSAAVSLTGSTRLQFGWGEYAQFPELRWVYSKLGGRGLLPARAIHTVAAIEQRIGARSRLRLEAYQRLDRDLLFRPLYEPRLIGGWIFTPPADAPALNSLRGYARGIEVMWQRRSANRFAGWISYALGWARMRDGVAGISFPADEDQRHTFNAYGSYRLRPTVNLSGRWIYGSGLPIPGFFSSAGGVYHLAEQRNAVRLAAYQRTDVRLNKAFVYRRAKLTLYAEVVNLFNHDNRRYDAFWGYNTQSNAAYPGFNRLFPILPSAGVVAEY